MKIENKIKEITGICDKWIEKRTYGLTYYYTFLDNEYCISMCKQKIGSNTYVVSNEDGKILYMGFSEENALNTIRKLVEQCQVKSKV